MKKYLRHILLLILFVIGLVFAGKSIIKSPELRAMLEASSKIQITTGYKVSSWYEDRGVVLGKPVYPEVMVQYKPINNFTLDDTYKEIITFFQTNNWKEEKLSVPQPGYFRASLPQEKFILNVSVLSLTDKDLVNIKFTTNSKW